MKYLVAIECSTYGIALEHLNRLGESSNSFELIECLYRGEKSTLIFFASDSDLSAFGDLSLDALIIEEPHPNLLPAYLNLINEPLLEKLFVFEANQLSLLLTASDALLKAGVKVFDIRSLRGSAGQGFVLATGVSVPEALVAKLTEKGSWKEIGPLTDSLRSQFQIHKA